MKLALGLILILAENALINGTPMNKHRDVRSINSNRLGANRRTLDTSEITLKSPELLKNLNVESRNTWDYEHQISWSNEYPTCGGIRQSPVEIDPETAIHVDQASCLKQTDYNNQHRYLTLENNGHTIEASSTWSIGDTPKIYGGPLNGTYTFGVIHWHWGGDFKHGSEHIINGTELPIEMHIVHYSNKFSSLEEAVSSGESEALAVVGVAFKMSAVPNLGLTIITKALQSAAAEGQQNSILPLGYLNLNFKDGYYSYIGSLTTPPCHQIVRWVVLETPLTISLQQLLVFRSVSVNGNSLVNNYRHVQPLNGRKIHYYSKCSS